MSSGKNNNNSIGFLELLFQATVSTDYTTLARNSASPATNLYVGLYTANPGATGDQTTSEAAYTGYTRVAVARSSGGWTITGETITNAGAINFPQCSGGTETETYVGIGTASTGAGVLLWFGQLTSSLAVSNGVTPSIAIGQLSITES